MIERCVILAGMLTGVQGDIRCKVLDHLDNTHIQMILAAMLTEGHGDIRCRVLEALFHMGSFG